MATRRNKKTSLPESPVRRRASAALQTESSGDRPSLVSSAPDSNSQGEPTPPPGSSKACPNREEKPPCAPEAASASLPDLLGAPKPPSPPCSSGSRESLDDDHGARGAAAQPGEMFGVLRSIPTHMDYKGQKLAEQIFQGIILVSAVIGFIYGYITEQFVWTVYIVMGGFALSCLLTLPPWPIYRRNPLKWLPVQELATDEKKPADKKVKRHPKN